MGPCWRADGKYPHFSSILSSFLVCLLSVSFWGFHFLFFVLSSVNDWSALISGPSSTAAIQLFFPFPQFDFQSFVAHKTLFRPLSWSHPSLYKLSLFKKIYWDYWDYSVTNSAHSIKRVGDLVETEPSSNFCLWIAFVLLEKSSRVNLLNWLNL